MLKPASAIARDDIDGRDGLNGKKRLFRKGLAWPVVCAAMAVAAATYGAEGAPDGDASILARLEPEYTPLPGLYRTTTWIIDLELTGFSKEAEQNISSQIRSSLTEQKDVCSLSGAEILDFDDLASRERCHEKEFQTYKDGFGLTMACRAVDTPFILRVEGTSGPGHVTAIADSSITYREGGGMQMKIGLAAKRIGDC